MTFVPATLFVDTTYQVTSKQEETNGTEFTCIRSVPKQMFPIHQRDFVGL